MHNPLNLDIIDATGFATGQPDRDAGHVNEIAASMETHGWHGAPLVVLSDYARAYTGTHRLAAAEQADLDYVPAVELADIFEACDLDLLQICEDEDLSILEDRPEVLRHLPDDIRAAYGLDDIC
ncbi:ParB N-terminal domain-containing protein [Nocardiopsis sp. NRRL B-16309]|uniref:ParB N-terminal domain-containing protein n=1 Tax=Nocardiopsis sp. NRRL B-16309 TaxID=1519494 RepID=UPI0006AE5829|nr:ParB N-terminal domain-containing protein [Nocardiopsis sp. NRRL B-16309]KOX10115.1 hypothetical protein ADL05_25885 [Nocardiopsis sp. NRRL B-16309]